MSAAWALARARVRRRRRWPRHRLVFQALMAGVSLAYLGYEVVRLVQGDLSGLFLGAMWVFAYVVHRRFFRRCLAYAERGLPIPPVSRCEWVLLGFLVACLATTVTVAP